MAFLCVLQLILSTSAFAQNASSAASRDCQSSDADRRLRGCTEVINARGFGSQSNLAYALHGRCWAYNDKEQFTLAIADCKASIRLRPRNFYAFNNLGTAYVGVGNYKDALSAFDTAIELKPDFYWSRFNRAKALVVVGRKEDAIKDYEYLLNRDPTNQGIRNLLHGLRAAIATQPDPNPPSPSDSRVISAEGQQATPSRKIEQRFGAQQTPPVAPQPSPPQAAKRIPLRLSGNNYIVPVL